MHNGYVKTEDGFTKSFPLNFPYRDKIIENFIRNAEAMFHEEAGIKPMNWREGFLHFASIAKEANLDWWTTGKLLLPLNGIETDIDDVDFYFDIEDLDAVCDAFSDYILEPVVTDTWRSKAFRYYGLAYSRCTVCLFAGPRSELDDPEPVHFGPYASKHLITVNWNGFDIKVPPIELYVKTLRRWGKHEAAAFITSALKGNGNGVVLCK